MSPVRTTITDGTGPSPASSRLRVKEIGRAACRERAEFSGAGGGGQDEGEGRGLQLAVLRGGPPVVAEKDQRDVLYHADDGIRDLYVTGVQTCALPISLWTSLRRPYLFERFR